MELTDELLVQISTYLSGTMPDTERRAFDARLEQEADLRREVTIQHDIRQGLLRLTQKQRFRAMHHDLQQRGLLPTAAETASARGIALGRRVFWQDRTYLTLAASLLLILGSGWFFVWKQSIPSLADQRRNRAFDEVFTPDLKSAPVLPPDPDRLGAPLPPTADQPDSLRLATGVVMLERHQFQAAIGQFRSIAEARPGHWQASAQWYLALAYLRTGQPRQTDSLLTHITGTGGHPYQAEAQQLAQTLSHLSATRP